MLRCFLSAGVLESLSWLHAARTEHEALHFGDQPALERELQGWLLCVRMMLDGREGPNAARCKTVQQGAGSLIRGLVQ